MDLSSKDDDSLLKTFMLHLNTTEKMNLGQKMSQGKPST